jgi:hypothetical protein
VEVLFLKVSRQTAEAYVFFERCASRNAYGRDVPHVGSRKVADLLKRFRARRLRQRPSASCPPYCWTEEEEEVTMGCASKDGTQLPGLSLYQGRERERDWEEAKEEEQPSAVEADMFGS